MHGRPQSRHQITFTDSLSGKTDFELRDLVHQVDMVHPFLVVLIALMHGINPQVARLSLRLRFAALANGRGPGLGFGEVPALLLVGVRAPQIIMARRNTAQALVTHITLLPGALTEFLDDSATGRLMKFIHLHQQTDIGIAVTAGKAVPKLPLANQPPRLDILPHKPGDLLSRITSVRLIIE